MMPGLRGAALVLAVGCGQTPSLSHSGAAAHTAAQGAPATLEFELHSEPVGVIYDYARLESRLAAGAGGAVALRLDAQDIVRAVVGPNPSSLIELQLSDDASAKFRAALPELSETVPFRVRLGDESGEESFVGVVYTAIGAAAIDTPVLHLASGDRTKPVVLFIGAQQGAAFGGSAPDAAHRVDTPRLRAALRARGVLTEQPTPLRFPLGP